MTAASLSNAIDLLAGLPLHTEAGERIGAAVNLEESAGTILDWKSAYRQALNPIATISIEDQPDAAAEPQPEKAVPEKPANPAATDTPLLAWLFLPVAQIAMPLPLAPVEGGQLQETCAEKTPAVPVAAELPPNAVEPKLAQAFALDVRIATPSEKTVPNAVKPLAAVAVPATEVSAAAPNSSIAERDSGDQAKDTPRDSKERSAKSIVATHPESLPAASDPAPTPTMLHRSDQSTRPPAPPVSTRKAVSISEIKAPPAPPPPTAIRIDLTPETLPAGVDSDTRMQLHVSQRGDEVRVRVASGGEQINTVLQEQIGSLVQSLSRQGVETNRTQLSEHSAWTTHESISAPSAAGGAEHGELQHHASQQHFTNPDTGDTGAQHHQQRRQQQRQPVPEFFLRRDNGLHKGFEDLLDEQSNNFAQRSF